MLGYWALDFIEKGGEPEKETVDAAFETGVGQSVAGDSGDAQD